MRIRSSFLSMLERQGEVPYKGQWGKRLPFMQFNLFHMCQPSQKEVEGKLMLVAVRHPISRALSIWNWRKYLCSNPSRRGREKSLCFDPEKDLFDRCTFNDFILGLGQNSSSPCSPHLLHHWDADHRWYLENIDPSYLNANAWTADQGSMASDAKKFFDAQSLSDLGQKVVSTLRFNNINSDYPRDVTELTATQKGILREFLSDEIAFYVSLRNRTVGL
mmetsp:Transcript_33773/g.52826  ORF Transcript_33773/g.52826 Transcript_33773/m.52826 type:complete len:219 (-) Transcript_33773:141-797(-)